MIRTFLFTILLIVTSIGAQARQQGHALHQQTASQSQPNVLKELISVLSTGDQEKYKLFVKARYSQKALAEYSVEEQAASLAKIYAETGGFRLLRVTVETERALAAEARDKILGQGYCLTLNRERGEGGEFISDFDAKATYVAGPNLVPISPGLLTRRIDEAASAYAARGLFSGVILLAKDDKIILEKAYGMSSVAYSASMRPSTRLNIASIGKMFTGVAIAQLVSAHKLSYDDTVGKILPDFPNAQVREKVTVRQLLTHTSGLGPRDYYDDPKWQAARPNLRSIPDYMKLVANTGIGLEPGKYHYSNAGYVILGAIIEKLTAQTYYDYVRDHIFEPTGMTRSFYHEMDHEDKDVAVPLTNLFNHDGGYLYRMGTPRNSVYELAAKGGPQGGAFVTAQDLLAFKRALLGGTLLSFAAVKEMTTAQGESGAGAPGLAGDVREGLGVEVVTRNGHTFFGHTGGDLGVASMLYWYPDTGYTTILLSNRDPRAARVLTNLTRALITQRTIRGAIMPDLSCTPTRSK
jgi:CubicO group peptidase (beta-lactamase class C family)